MAQDNQAAIERLIEADALHGEFLRQAVIIHAGRRTTAHVRWDVASRLLSLLDMDPGRISAWRQADALARSHGTPG